MQRPDMARLSSPTPSLPPRAECSICHGHCYCQWQMQFEFCCADCTQGCTWWCRDVAGCPHSSISCGQALPDDPAQWNFARSYPHCLRAPVAFVISMYKAHRACHRLHVWRVSSRRSCLQHAHGAGPGTRPGPFYPTTWRRGTVAADGDSVPHACICVRVPRLQRSTCRFM